MDDADAAAPRMPRVDQELFDAGERRRGDLAMQIQACAGRVLTSFELPDLAAVEAWRGVAILARVRPIFVALAFRCGRARRWWCERPTHAPARIRPERPDIVHRTRELVGVGRGGRVCRIRIGLLTGWHGLAFEDVRAPYRIVVLRGNRCAVGEAFDQGRRPRPCYTTTFCAGSHPS